MVLTLWCQPRGWWCTCCSRRGDRWPWPCPSAPGARQIGAPGRVGHQHPGTPPGDCVGGGEGWVYETIVTPGEYNVRYLLSTGNRCMSDWIVGHTNVWQWQWHYPHPAIVEWRFVKWRLSKPLIHTWPSAGSERRTVKWWCPPHGSHRNSIHEATLHSICQNVYMSVNSQSHFPAYVAVQTLCRKFHQHWPFFT